MHILLITQYFWPEEFRINELAAMMAERGHQVTVLTGIPNYPGGRFFPGYGFTRQKIQHYKAIKVVRVSLIPRGKGGRIRLALNYLSFALNASLMGAIKCSDAYDVIFVYEPSPITVGFAAIIVADYDDLAEKGSPVVRQLFVQVSQVITLVQVNELVSPHWGLCPVWVCADVDALAA